MLKVLFEQMIAQYSIWTMYKIPKSDSPYTKYRLSPLGENISMIIELNTQHWVNDFNLLQELINKEIYVIMSIKFY
jgi:hypothetical protein|nr:MAG TPA: hypothetical protein [Caudoviricetes sp.]